MSKNKILQKLEDLKPIILSGTIPGGGSSLTIKDSRITTSSIINVYTDQYGIVPLNINVSNGSIALTFDAQSTALGVKVEVK